MKRLLTFALFALIVAFAAPAAKASDTITAVISPSGGGTVTSSTGGVNCPTTCTSSSIGGGTTVTMTASPSGGFGFTSWTVTGSAGTNPTTCVTGATSASCTFTTPTGGGNATTIQANFAHAPALTKSFSPTSIAVAATSTLTLVISNANAASMTGAGVVDPLPTNMKVAGTPNPTNSCAGGTWAPAANATTLTLSNETVPANGSCTVTVAVTTTVSGSFVNLTNAPTSSADGTGTAATATLTVVGVASKLAFTTSPSNSTAGSAFGTQPVVALEDASGNIVTGTAQNVTLTIQNNVGSGTLSGTTTVAVNTSTGLATFSGLSINKSGTGYTLTAAGSTVNTSPGTIISGSFNITAGTATQLVFTTPPSTPNNGGSAFGTQPIVSVEDANNNVVTTATNSIALAIGTNPVSGTLTCTSNTVSAIAGAATFAACKIDKASTGYTLTATAAGLTTATTGAITIQVGPAAKLAFGVSPSNTAAGSSITPAVTVLIQDAGGNQTTSTASVSLAITTNPGTGTLTGGGAIAAVNGTATFSALSINKSGNGYILTASSSPLTSVASGTFNITAGTATQLAFTTNPSNSTGGVAFVTQPQVTLQDANNNTVTGTAQTVTLAIQTNPSSGTLSGTATATVNTGTGIATFSGLSIDKSGNGYTLTATGSTVSLTAGVVLSTAFNITVGPANKLAFTVSPSNGTGGVAFPTQPVVALEDAGGNIVTGTAQTVTASIQNNGGGGTLAGTTAITLNTGTGLATFTNLSINKIGNGYTLTVKGSTVNTIAGVIITTPFNITVGTATQLVFGQQPTNTAAGSSITPAITVLIEDAGGNLTSSTASVSMAITTNPGTSTLSGTISQPGVAGTATFGDLSLNKSSNGYILTASGTGLGTVASSTFNITAGLATQLVFTTQPGGGTGGTSWTTQPAVSVEDANNNVVTSGTNSTASITLAIGTNAGPGGTLTCTTNPRSAVAGVDTFAGCKIDLIGTGYTLTAAAAGLTGATSNPFNITVGGAAKLQIGVQPTNTQDTVAISPAVTVQILDAGGNLTTSTANVTFAIGNNAGPAGVLSGTLTHAGVAGTATFSDLSINKIGTGYTLIASSGALTTATTSPFNITLGPATKLGFSVQPVNTENHVTITPSVVVQIQDAGGNLVSAASDTITVAIGANPSTGTLTGTLSQPTASGAATFNDLSIDNVGTAYTLTANGVGGFTNTTSSTFNITPGPATQLLFTTQPSASAAPNAAFAIQPVVSVEDAHGNIMTSGTGSTASITLAIGTNAGPGGVLTCTANPKAAVAGVDAFAGCKINLVGNGYTLTASSAGLTGATSSPINITLGNAKQVTDQASSNCSTAAGTTCTITLNLAGVTSTNNVLLVGISNPSTSTVSTVKWGGASGTALTQVPGCAATGTNNSSAHFEIWSLTNPNLSASPDTVVITFTTSQTIYAGAALFSNVASLGTCQTANGTAGSGSVTLTVSQAGGAGFDTASITSFNSGSGSITTPAGQTNLWSLNGTAPSAGAGSYAAATGTALTMTQTFNYAIGFRQVFAYGAVPLNPVISAHKAGKVVIGSLLDQEKPNPSIFHLGNDARSTNSSIAALTNSDQNINDSNSAIITKRDN